MPTVAAFTLIDENRSHAVDATVRGDAVRVAPEAIARALGWELKSQGLCRDDTCIPVRERDALVDRDGIDLATLARLLDRPLALDAAEGVAVLGASAGVRAGRLASLDAPDFTLPDLDGRLHSLAGYRGRKVLLIAWASW
jgi:hypothetical protein